MASSERAANTTATPWPANARAVEAQGGAWVITEDILTPDNMAQRIEQVLSDPSKLATAAARARAIGHPDAVDRLVDAARALIDDPNGRKVAA